MCHAIERDHTYYHNTIVSIIVMPMSLHIYEKWCNLMGHRMVLPVNNEMLWIPPGDRKSVAPLKNYPPFSTPNVTYKPRSHEARAQHHVGRLPSSKDLVKLRSQTFCL